LAYIIRDTNQIQYENEGAWARTYSDVSAFWKLVEYLKKHKFITETEEKDAALYVQKAQQLETPDDDPVSRLLFLLDVPSTDDKEMNQLVNQISQSKLYIDQKDTSFATPQAMLAISRYHNTIKTIPSFGEMIHSFLDLYIVNKELEKAIQQNQVFAANWILQALGALLQSNSLSSNTRNIIIMNIQTVLEPVCEKAVLKQRSITETACAFHGIMTVVSYLTLKQKNQWQQYWKQTVREWRTLQLKWKTGGFRYYVNENWYRTDVTSHVVAVLLLNRLRFF
jgi:hypothetical protein